MKSNFIMDIVFTSGKLFDRLRNIIHNSFKEQKELILQNFSRTANTLDFGCGAAPFSVIFNPEYYYGVDMDEKYIMFCKRNRNGNFSLIKDSPPYDFNDGFFDQILISAVVHHLDDATLLLIGHELNRLLSQNGRLIIIDPFTRKNQKSLLCKILISLDRGHNFRDPDTTINILSKIFNLNKKHFFKNGPYKFYMLLFTKK